jgi:hypothetical protein
MIILKAKKLAVVLDRAEERREERGGEWGSVGVRRSGGEKWMVTGGEGRRKGRRREKMGGI